MESEEVAETHVLFPKWRPVPEWRGLSYPPFLPSLFLTILLIRLSFHLSIPSSIYPSSPTAECRRTPHDKHGRTRLAVVNRRWNRGVGGVVLTEESGQNSRGNSKPFRAIAVTSMDATPTSAAGGPQNHYFEAPLHAQPPWKCQGFTPVYSAPEPRIWSRTNLTGGRSISSIFAAPLYFALYWIDSQLMKCMYFIYCFKLNRQKAAAKRLCNSS